MSSNYIIILDLTLLYIVAAGCLFAMFAIVSYLKHKPPGMQTLYDLVTINSLGTGIVLFSVQIFNITVGVVGGKIFFEFTGPAYKVLMLHL
jgi:hypothetical protein